MSGEQIYDLVRKYPDLYYNEDLEELIGELKLNHVHNNEHIVNQYKIRIALSDWLNGGLPSVYEISDSIPDDYSHIYNDGMLCLSTDIEQKVHFTEGGMLSDWYEDFVIPYFFSMEYYVKYGKFPNGDRSHNKLGVIESYFDIFDVKEETELAEMFKYILKEPYRGHNLCPCNSGRKVRNCHGEVIRKWKQNEYKEMIQQDLKYLILN